MIKSIRRNAVTAGTVIAIGGTVVVMPYGPAEASSFSATYTCSVPVLGSRSVTIDGRLTASPERATPGRPVRFQLHISRLNLRTPVAIDSWTAVAEIDVTGAQSTSFRMTGTGGPVTPRQPISGDLFGSWTPRAHGTDHFRGANVALTAKVARVGRLTAGCTPTKPRPLMETVTVTSPSARQNTDL
ncbi:hypothetical protein OG417_41725 [Actinoallomurus sp. NBC_01490]|uniref:hypothetical protein n=1 Tax=Actinoallomurus sp. NBC_01490 TaxID=2903557 RepID=UPI002E2EB6CC|nr:hypothetical protein [Actinoallomurus sp. NBC_01490]